MSAPRVYVPDVNGPIVALPDEESHHIGRVLRLKSGDPIVIFNGLGASWDAEIAGGGKHATAKILHARPPLPALPARVSLAIGLLKGDAMDSVVRDATALDVAEIIPMVTARSVVPKGARGAGAIARWRRVAVASAKQCGQIRLPVISDVSDLAGVLHREPSTKLMCVEPALGGAGVSAIASDSILILIGPEGGWAEEEIQAARAVGAHTITLGRLTLRAELAPVVAITKVWSALTA